MNSLQINLLTLLKEIDSICRNNDIIYYLAGGTALGAVRAGAFLPWDDDIDIYITRDNWNKLVKVMETETPENRSFICTENTDKYCNPIGRYVHNGTTSMMKSQLLCGKSCGQVIEFLILDPMPNSEEGKWRHRKLMKIYTELLTPYFTVNRGVMVENSDFDFDLYNMYYEKSKKKGKTAVLEEILNEICKTEDNDKTDTYCMRWGLATLMYGKDGFGNPRYEKFEDYKFPVGSHAEYIFRVAYGDSWMYVPQSDGQVIHVTERDLTTPFSQYVDMYMPLLNKDKLWNSYILNKEIGIEQLKSKEEKQKNFARCKLASGLLHINREGYDINTMWNAINSGDLLSVKSKLNHFFEIQNDKYVKKYKLLMEIEDDYLAVAILFTVLSGQYYKSSRIVSIITSRSKKISGKLSKAIDLWKICRELSIAIYDFKDPDKAQKLIKKNSNTKDILRDYVKAELWIGLQNSNLIEDIVDVEEKALSALDKYGRDGELLSFYAEALYRQGKINAAKTIYKEAIENTRNGFVWRAAKDLFGLVNSEMREMEYD